MDERRFDNWTRELGRRVSRREALKAAGIGGAAAAFSRVASVAEAQGACTLTIHAETIGGPSAPVVFDGVLQFAVASDGLLTQAAYMPGGGNAVSANGFSMGRSIDFEILLAPNQVLVYSGLGDDAVALCQGAFAGIFSGPRPGDLGAWLASASSSNDGTTATCPAGQLLCGHACVAGCPSGQTLNPQTCACAPNQPDCTPDQSPCEFDYECCGTFCSSGACGTCPGLVCGDMGCVDQFTDPFNCGSCRNTCTGNTPKCSNGMCTCIPDGEPVGNSSSTCCSAGNVKPDGTCGCSHIGELCSSVGQCCENPSGAVCVQDPPICCWNSIGASCTMDGDCCFNLKCTAGACANP